MNRYRSYSKCKPSGIDWLGDVPSHWQVARLKVSIASTQNGIWGEDPKGDMDDIPCVRVADFDRNHLCVQSDIPTLRRVTQKERAGRLLKKGDLLLEKSGGGEKQPVGQVVRFQLDIPAVSSNFITRMSLTSGMSSDFWNYVHAALYFARRNTLAINQTSGIQNLDQERYFNERVAIPPSKEQTEIAKNLTHETSRIDALISRKTRFIELLKERRESLITHVVTKGIDPNAKMKDSSVAYIGDIPAHWKVVQIRRLVDEVKQGWSPECLPSPAGPEEWGVLKAGCVNGGLFRQEENKALPANLSPLLNLEVKVGDVLISRASGTPEFVGSAAIVENLSRRLMLSDKIFRVALREGVDPRYFVMTLGARPLRAQIENELSGGNGLANNLPQTALQGFLFPLPPEIEQQGIVGYTRAAVDRIDSLTKKTERSVALLVERRACLITAAITGQIDLGSAA